MEWESKICFGLPIDAGLVIVGSSSDQLLRLPSREEWKAQAFVVAIVGRLSMLSSLSWETTRYRWRTSSRSWRPVWLECQWASSFLCPGRLIRSRRGGGGVYWWIRFWFSFILRLIPIFLLLLFHTPGYCRIGVDSTGIDASRSHSPLFHSTCSVWWRRSFFAFSSVKCLNSLFPPTFEIFLIFRLIRPLKGGGALLWIFRRSLPAGAMVAWTRFHLLLRHHHFENLSVSWDHTK